MKISSEDAIVESALEVLSRDSAASLATVALRAGVGRATLYRYFPTREDLVRELCRRALAETDAATAGLLERADGPRAALEALFRALIPLADRFHFLGAHAAAADRGIRRGYARQVEQLGQLVDLLAQAGEIDPALPRSWAAAHIDALIWTAWTEVHAGRVAREEAAALAVRTALSGLRPELRD
jgi:AcrR family transcriptional regulator